MLLLLEIGATIALLVAGLYLWRLQDTLAEELRWAQHAQAAVNASSAAMPDAPPDSSASADLSGPADLTPAPPQRVRVPALGLDYRLHPQAIRQASTPADAALAGTLYLILPVDVYGADVCTLAQLEPGDAILLDMGGHTLSYQVAAGTADPQAARGSHRVVVAAYPCSQNRERVLVSATGSSAYLP